MAEEAPAQDVDCLVDCLIDFWSELEEAHQTVEQWPEWRQRYEADVNFEENPTP